MSTAGNDPNNTQKADQIAHRFFAKFANLVAHARAITEQRSNKVDKWFNLETPDSEVFRDHLRLYRSISTATNSTLPPLELQVLLTIPELTTNQVLVHLPDAVSQGPSRVRVEPSPRAILLESWVLQFLPSPTPSSSASSAPRGVYTPTDERSPPDIALPSVYKHGISLFRSLFTLLRVMPSWKLCKRFRRRTGGITRNTIALGIEVRVRPANEGYGDPALLGFDKPLSQSASSIPTKEYIFPPLVHPSGAFSLSTTYLTDPTFQIDTLESLLSSRIMSDEGPDFTPTLARHSLSNTAQSHGYSGAGNANATPGSLPIRMALPRSPPRTTTLADRFVLPAPSATSSVSTHTYTQNQAVAHQRTTSFPGSGSSGSPGGLAAASGMRGAAAAAAAMTRTGNVSADAVVPGLAYGPSASGLGGSPRGLGGLTAGRDESSVSLAARLRRESMTTTRPSTSADLPSAPSPLPIRRPAINPVNPFKSGTLSSGSPSLHSPSPSLRLHSPLSGPSLPSRPTLPQSPSMRVPPSPIGIPVPSSLGDRDRGYTPSSLGERRSLEGAGAGEESPGTGGPRRRYQSSFGHRYNSSVGAVSDGSPGSADKKDGERPGPGLGGGNTSFMSTNTDDDDISAFVQDIDARKPLSNPGHDREGTATLASARALRRSSAPTSGLAGSPSTSIPSGIANMSSISTNRHTVTTHTEIESRLKELNDNFFASLEGLGGPRRPRSTSGTRAAAPRSGAGATGVALAAGVGRGNHQTHAHTQSADSVSGSEPPSHPGSAARSRTTSLRGRSPALGLAARAALGAAEASPSRSAGAGSEYASGSSGGPIGGPILQRPTLHGSDSVGSEEVLGRLELEGRSRRSSFRDPI